MFIKGGISLFVFSPFILFVGVMTSPWLSRLSGWLSLSIARSSSLTTLLPSLPLPQSCFPSFDRMEKMPHINGMTCLGMMLDSFKCQSSLLYIARAQTPDEVIQACMRVLNMIRTSAADVKMFKMMGVDYIDKVLQVCGRPSASAWPDDILYARDHKAYSTINLCHVCVRVCGNVGGSWALQPMWACGQCP